jgi:2-methylcitrate dehydratase PrpD
MAQAKSLEPIVRALSDWAAEATLRVPASALRQARLSFLDTLGCAQAGAPETDAKRVYQAMLAAGHRGDARTLLAGPALSGPGAALVHGACAHMIDFDDYEEAGSTHPSAPIVAALLPFSDLRPAPLDRFLEAYLVGYETIVRLGEALGYDHYLAGWHATATLGPIGAAAACARFLQGDAATIATAMTLATSAAAGLKAQFGSAAKPLHAGLAARSGLEAASLAGAGVAANPEVWRGEFGFARVYGGRTSETSQSGLIGAGSERYPMLRKSWPCCAYAQRSIEAALSLGSIPFDSIEAVSIRMPAPYAAVAGKPKPATPSEARFSTQYCVAAALWSGRLTPGDFETGAISRGPIQDLVDRTTIEAYEPDFAIADMDPRAPDSVTLTLRGGAQRMAEIAEVYGGPTRPLSEADLIAKHLHCGGSDRLIETLIGPDPSGMFKPIELLARY